MRSSCRPGIGGGCLPNDASLASWWLAEPVSAGTAAPSAWEVDVLVGRKSCSLLAVFELYITLSGVKLVRC